MEHFLRYRGSRERVELAFFGGNFLGLSTTAMLSLLDTALQLANENKINGIRFSTRPDTITEERLDLISRYPVSTIELGVQSMNDTVLQRAKRGHSSEDTVNAATLLKQFGCRIGMQMMVGLPDDSDEIAIDTAQKIAGLSPDFVRIYPLMVLEGSRIATWYRRGQYRAMSLKHCVHIVKELFLIFKEHQIKVIRMGLQASDLMQDDRIMLAGPWHPAFGHLVYSELFFDKLLELINRKIEIKPARQIKYNGINTIKASSMKANTIKASSIKASSIKASSMKTNTIKASTIKAVGITTMTLTVHPSSISRLQGDKKRNMKRISALFPSILFKIKTDRNLGIEDITLNS